jgi:hypothetical protein
MPTLQSARLGRSAVLETTEAGTPSTGLASKIGGPYFGDGIGIEGWQKSTSAV